MRFSIPQRFALVSALFFVSQAAVARDQNAPNDAAPAAEKRAKVAPRWTGPIATYPGFRMLEGGGSRVVVDIRGKIEVSEHKGEGLMTYRLRGVAAPSPVNRMPLVTAFFPTPVSRVQLVDRKGDLDLVIELKEPAVATFRVVPTRTGIQLQIDFPKPGKAPSVSDADAPQAE